MFNKYSNVLTMLLIVIIVAILAIIGYFAFDLIHSKNVNTNAKNAINEFEESTKKIEKQKKEEKDDSINENVQSPVDLLIDTNKTEEQPQEREKVYMENYEVKGTIEIPKTQVNYPVLESVTRRTLEMAVGIAYPLNAELNQVGNTVIYGHNYRNGLFFSNNKKLSNGDLIYITDSSGTKVTYEIYKIYQTSPNDASFFTRDTNGRREISLQTCTDDNNGRIIIWAAEKQ